MIHRCPMNSLLLEGPIVAAKLGPDPVHFEALALRGDPPPPLPVHLLVDTGAELSMIDQAYAGWLGLRPIRRQIIVGVHPKPEVHQVYARTLHLPIDQPTPQFVTVPISLAGMREPIGRMRYDGLLGRDFLAVFCFRYDGPRNVFEIELMHLPNKNAISHVR